MATAVEMPKLGNTVEDCLLATWHKDVGDEVRAGDIIAEIETDKTTFELTAPIDGVLLETFFAEVLLSRCSRPYAPLAAWAKVPRRSGRWQASRRVRLRA